MRLLGAAEWFEDEALFAMAGHLSGAGPAFLFRYLDALAAAGASLGLRRTRPPGSPPQWSRARRHSLHPLPSRHPSWPAASPARAAPPRRA
jgi:hypothetical protein